MLAALVVALLAASPAAADVPPGFDLFETDPSATVFSFREEFTIPANFFDQGSAPFQGDVQFGGLPLNTFMRRDVGDTDTVVRRLTNAALPQPFPRTSQPIPIQLVALSLQSMGPINVVVGNTTQQWDVRAGPSPTRPSGGDMVITQQSSQGGTFQSQLEVYPRFVFRRLSDGAQRAFDVGQQQLTPQAVQKLRLAASGVPWRAGCALPALSVPALSTAFCPSFTPARQKVLTREQATRVVHGVRPAQHRTEHFKCYGLVAATPLTPPRSPRLIDQFGNVRSTSRASLELCNPVQKNTEPLVNRAAHLQCYSLGNFSAPFRSRVVRIRNQFGSEVLSVRAPRSLCVPSRKARPRRRLPAITVFPDHFKCYTVRPRATFRARTVGLRDQFETRRARVVTPVLLCNPAEKRTTTVTRIQHPVHHLVCYAIRDVPSRRLVPVRLVRTLNQFGLASLATGRPRFLCVPSLKVPT